MDNMKQTPPPPAHGHGADTDAENVEIDKTGRVKSSMVLHMSDDMALRMTMYQQIFFVLDQVQASASVCPAHDQPPPAHDFEHARRTHGPSQLRREDLRGFKAERRLEAPELRSPRTKRCRRRRRRRRRRAQDYGGSLDVDEISLFGEYM